MVDVYTLGTVECPNCKERDKLELVFKLETEKETRGEGFNSVRVVPIFSVFYRCTDCGELFMIQIDPDKDGKKVKQ